MSLFRKIFGSGDPLAPVRKALQQRRWADALALGTALEREALEADAAAALEELLASAGDGLAELNLSEGEGCIRSGDLARAEEHFALAASQARDPGLVARIASARGEAAPSAPKRPAPSVSAHSCTGDCSHGGSAHLPPSAAQEDLDPQTRLELVLASYPPAAVPAYLQASAEFREAFLLAHEGREQEALERFDRLPGGERDAHFYFERGSLRARLGEVEGGCRDLEETLARDPDHLLAMEALVTLLVASGRDAAALERLESMLQRGFAPAFCHGTIAGLAARRGDAQGALRHALEAVAARSVDPAVLLLAADLLEREGRSDEAEGVLRRFPGGGCSGGISVPLAEFWLRRNKSLDKVLEAFKGAMRQEPGEPRWAFRIAQTYLARGWKADGAALLKKAMSDPRLDPELQREGEALLHGLR